MQFTIERLKTETALLVRLIGVVSLSETETLFQQIAAQMEQFQGRVHVLYDFSAAELPNKFMDTVKIVRLSGQGKPGSPSDPRIIPSFIINNYSGIVLKDLLTLKHFGGIDIPVFLSLEAAKSQINLRREMRSA